MKPVTSLIGGVREFATDEISIYVSSGTRMFVFPTCLQLMGLASNETCR